MRRESHVRFCERLKVKFLGPTHQVKGIWKYLYRAVDKVGKTVDFLLTAIRMQTRSLKNETYGQSGFATDPNLATLKGGNCVTDPCHKTGNQAEPIRFFPDHSFKCRLL
jgi:hypothetical protein